MQTETMAAPAMPRLPQRPHLTPDELKKIVGPLESPPLVNELHAWVVRQLEDEDARLVSLDQKATTLLTAAGLSVTVLFAFGATIATHRPPSLPGIVAATTAALVGLATAFLAIAALGTRKYGSANERTMFDVEWLRVVDGTDEAVRDYQRFVIPHLWDLLMWRKNVNDEKAAWVRRGQVAYMAFLFVTAFLTIAVVSMFR